jgi:predicted transcriptional regulator YdeE
MNIEIITTPFTKTLYGFSGTAVNKNYAATGFRLMGEMWQKVKSNGLKNKGINIWVYEHNDLVFAGVELDETPPATLGLERKEVSLSKYAYYKHIGPYNKIAQAGQQMMDELATKNIKTCLPYVEVYGHSTPDETKSETELLQCVQ